MEGTREVYTFGLNPEVQNKNEKKNDAKVKTNIIF